MLLGEFSAEHTSCSAVKEEEKNPSVSPANILWGKGLCEGLHGARPPQDGQDAGLRTCALRGLGGSHP